MPKLNLTIDLDPSCGEDEMKSACRVLKAQTYADALHEIDERARTALKHNTHVESYAEAMQAIRDLVAAAYNPMEGV